MNVALVVTIAILAVGCTASRGTSVPNDVTYEVESVTEQAVSAVEETATSFEVDPASARYVWERAEFFYRHYLGLNEQLKFTENSKVLAGADKLGFMWRVTGGTGTATGTFAVSCDGGNGNDRLAELNARNLARFLNTGTLEVDLLPR